MTATGGLCWPTTRIDRCSFFAGAKTVHLVGPEGIAIGAVEACFAGDRGVGAYDDCSVAFGFRSLGSTEQRLYVETVNPE